MAGMMSNGTSVGDGTWMLEIGVTDMSQNRVLRVRGDMHIGGLMLKLVEELDVSRDWSDHALWWPARRRWLLHTRATLDQCGVTADAQLEFTPMHKMARVQLPDLQVVDAKIDFSVPVFNATVQLCKELGIRYPEELSIKRMINAEQLRKGLGFEQDQWYAPSQQQLDSQRAARNATEAAQSLGIQGLRSPQHQGSLPPPSPGGTLNRPSLNRGALNTYSANTGTSKMGGGTGTLRLGSPGPDKPHMSGTLQSRAPVITSMSWAEGISAEQFDQNLIHSPRYPPQGSMTGVLRPRTMEEKAALNRGWLDSSRSLLEQGIREADTILLRFKFTNFFDINMKYDPVRINQLFEQSKWSVINEEYDCTEEEAYMFAALQLQGMLKSGAPEPRPEEGDDVDLMLNELEQQLDGVSIKRDDILTVPELSEYLRYFKPKKLTLKAWKRAFFIFKDLHMSWYNAANEAQGPPVGRIPLKGCEVTPDVNISQGKYMIKLLVPSPEGMNEFYVKCDSEKQYVNWMAACRLASRGKTMADAGYAVEQESLRRLLEMQQPVTFARGPPSSQHTDSMGGNADGLPMGIKAEELLSQRYVRRARSRANMEQRINEAHNNVRSLSGQEAKLQYVRAWQALPEFGVHYFIVRFRGAKKNELLGIAHNRLMKMTMDTGDSVKTWRFSQMKKWHVNWEIKHLLIQFEEEDVEFRCESADCKIPHEFIGGYIFLSMRNKEQNQNLNEELFHKLTGGWANLMWPRMYYPALAGPASNYNP